ncbi:hypothetical protein BXZ70DRAFT_341344 [Cristinia sonorae]|uniref:Uncharacterized protein n=1 Tax=Cristinia sonorae TaxID=1940300 RepID=A0A8K0UJJ1_9AGAR|nr:hypothetical protein BXZ70DRAFT_341344 [Cristinia sonorae]
MASNATVAKIDDRDPQINYFGSWFDVGSNDPAVNNATLSFTQERNAGLWLVFVGTQISVYGSVVVRPGALPYIVQFLLDDEPAVEVTQLKTSSDATNILIWQSRQLAAAGHQLIVNVTRATVGSPFYVDYLTYRAANETDPSPITTSSSISTTASTVSTSSTSTSSTTSLPPSPSDPPSNTDIKKVPVGPIAGGVVAGVVGIAIILLGLWFWCRRRNRIRAPGAYSDDASGPTPAMRDTTSALYVHGNHGPFVPGAGESQTRQVTPYVLPLETSDPGSVSAQPTSYFPTSESSTLDPLIGGAGGSDYSGSGSASVPTPNVAGSRAPHSPQGSISDIGSRLSDKGPRPPRALPVPSPPPPQQHADSGIRFPPTDTVLLEAPPAYTPD